MGIDILLSAALAGIFGTGGLVVVSLPLIRPVFDSLDRKADRRNGREMERAG